MSTRKIGKVPKEKILDLGLKSAYEGVGSVPGRMKACTMQRDVRGYSKW